MPSESVCYPAKLSTATSMNLIDKGVDFICMPCVRWERKEDETAGNCYNCPIVMSYPTALKLNIDELERDRIEFMNPFVPYHDAKELKRRLFELVDGQRWDDAQRGYGRFAGPRITRAEVDAAVDEAWAEDLRFKDDMHRAGEDALEVGRGAQAATASCSPAAPTTTTARSTTPSPRLVNSYGFAVLTEDSRGPPHASRTPHPRR